MDDKCLIIEFEDNVILLNGCCHSGLKNTIEYVKSQTKKPISHIIGGFHMSNASDYRINNTIDYLQNFQEYQDDIFLFPVHCTGEAFYNNILLKNTKNKEKLKSKTFNTSVGTQFIFRK